MFETETAFGLKLKWGVMGPPAPSQGNAIQMLLFKLFEKLGPISHTVGLLNLKIYYLEKPSFRF